MADIATTQKLIQDYLAGLSYTELGEKYDYSPGYVKRLLKANKVKLSPEERAKRETAGGTKNLKYGDDVKKSIQALKDEGLSCKEISQRLQIPLFVVKRNGKYPDKALVNANVKKGIAVILKERNKKIAAYWNSESGRANASEKLKKRWLTKEFRESTVARMQKPRLSKFTWESLSDVCQTNGLTVLVPYVDGPIYEITQPRHIRCFCGNVWTPMIGGVLEQKSQSCGCVKSKPQIEIRQLVESLGFEVKFNDRKTIAPLELDIYIPSKNLAIEYCGLYWHGQYLLGTDAYTKHRNKQEVCQKAGIRLVTIFENEWLDRREAVEGYLKAILGAKMPVVGARKLDLVEVRGNDAEDFLERNHIQGYVTARYLGLVLDGQLAVVAGFKETGEGHELVRYAVKSGMAVPGGIERLIKAYIGLYKPTKIFSFSDLRWSTGGVYKRLGFAETKTTPPSYWYFETGTQGPLFHKSNFRKEKITQKLGPLLSGETEWEAMQRFGFDRIWDCGKVKWEKILL